MEHLTDEQIVDFVTSKGLNEENLNKASVVTGHIIRCRECFEKVKAYQQLFDELQRAALDHQTRTALEELQRQRTESKPLEKNLSGNN